MKSTGKKNLLPRNTRGHGEKHGTATPWYPPPYKPLAKVDLRSKLFPVSFEGE